jgi:hypothetical protein
MLLQGGNGFLDFNTTSPFNKVNLIYRPEIRSAKSEILNNIEFQKSQFSKRNALGFCTTVLNFGNSDL